MKEQERKKQEKDRNNLRNRQEMGMGSKQQIDMGNMKVEQEIKAAPKAAQETELDLRRKKEAKKKAAKEEQAEKDRMREAIEQEMRQTIDQEMNDAAKQVNDEL